MAKINTLEAKIVMKDNVTSNINAAVFKNEVNQLFKLMEDNDIFDKIVRLSLKNGLISEYNNGNPEYAVKLLNHWSNEIDKLIDFYVFKADVEKLAGDADIFGLLNDQQIETMTEQLFGLWRRGNIDSAYNMVTILRESFDNAMMGISDEIMEI